MIAHERKNRWLALALAPWIAIAACADEDEAPAEDPTETQTGAVSTTDSTRRWFAVTGLLNDIATGNGPSSRWGIDTNDGIGGFRVVRWSGSSWVATNGRAVRIALRGSGDANGDGKSDTYRPWVVTREGHIFRATDANGSIWVQMSDLPNGVRATDIGSGTPVSNMSMWAIGTDGNVYQFEEANFWVIAPNSPGNSPSPALRVSGPIFGTTATKQVMVMAAGGQVFFLNQNGFWVALGTPFSLHTDISAGSSLPTAQADGFLSSIMLTSLSNSPFVRAFKPTNGTGAGFFTGTGAYAVNGAVIRSPPIAVSSDNDRKRVWIVTEDHHVYYGE
jgi:hypothetical protein